MPIIVDSAMTFVNNVWHKLGGHQWTEWSYVPRGDVDYEERSPCKQRRVCAWPECPTKNEAKEFRVTHRKLEWAYCRPQKMRPVSIRRSRTLVGADRSRPARDAP